MNWRVSSVSEITVVDSSGADIATICGDYDTDFERMADRAKLISAVPDLVNGINALLGLITLVCSRSDLSVDIKQALEHSHRMQEAKDALAKAGL